MRREPRSGTLTRAEARAFYDRFGERQDRQGFYEDAALEELLAHGEFNAAAAVFEFGCGTGRFADRLLQDYLGPAATYLGTDLSATMANLATRRLAPWGERARVMRSDGAIRFPGAARSVDRVVCTYVFDLLAEEEIVAALAEAARILEPGGRLCAVSLGRGVSRLSRLVATLWTALFSLNARWVGGCRPIDVASRLDPQDWQPVHREVVTPWGIPSEVLVATRR